MHTTLSDQPVAILLSDYTVPDYLVEKTQLFFELTEENTKVTAITKIKLNPKSLNQKPDVILLGRQLKCESIKINDVTITNYKIDEESLTIPFEALPTQNFVLEIITSINPKANTALEGLYLSNDMYCTQCEAQGFRKITYFPDRPDIMSEYEVMIIGNEKTPLMLSNGNLIEKGILEDGRPFAKWHDPHLKPSYLFALVAGDLGVFEDKFITKSGRHVDLKIFVEHGNERKCAYAMDSLKRSMKWDEDVFSLEYDLDLFMIVAVSDFNMGAMENKGLNIFNAKYVLADPLSATDTDYEFIEGIVAHEYFHNWTGNRVTCRDWFQLCLKEGLTVFRDQEFSADMRSRAVKRIDDVMGLRAAQFNEDSGPLAHPVRPEKYIEINNFYTSTVYEKGAELCRMIHTLLGKDGFRKGMDLYFQCHDGQAVTVEDFIQAMADANQYDLSQFFLWYKQAGIPKIQFNGKWNSATKEYTLNIKQNTPITPDQDIKYPLYMPVKTALIAQNGNEIECDYSGEQKTEHLLILKESEQNFTFKNVNEQPIPSLFRGFSAPIDIVTKQEQSDLLHLMRYDSDNFNRWEAGQTIAMSILTESYKGEDTTQKRKSFIQALDNILKDNNADNAFKAFTFSVPSTAALIQKIGHNVDPEKMYQMRKDFMMELARELKGEFESIYHQLNIKADYSPDANNAAKRSIKNCALGFLNFLDDDNTALAYQQFLNADNMTDSMAALGFIVNSNSQKKQEVLNSFFERWKEDANVLDKWFAVQARSVAENTLQDIKHLTQHSHYSFINPNRMRSVISVFAHGNTRHFNRTDGEGYKFVADTIIKMNEINPMVAARLATAFESWKVLNINYQNHIKQQLQRILDETHNISKDVYEIVTKTLKG